MWYLVEPFGGQFYIAIVVGGNGEEEIADAELIIAFPGPLGFPGGGCFGLAILQVAHRCAPGRGLLRICDTSSSSPWSPPPGPAPRPPPCQPRPDCVSPT